MAESAFCTSSRASPLPLTTILRLPGSGTYTVVYTYAPAAPQIGGETAFSDKVSARLLAFGVAKEYLLSAGRYAEATVWESKFREALQKAGLSRRKLCVRARRWV